MTGLAALWVPILLSAVLVFIASSLIHMASPWHKSDYPRMPNEDAVTDALRPLAIPPGDYMVPRPASMKEMRSPEFLERLNRGPVMVVTVLPNGPGSMGRNLGLWFVYLLVVSFFSAHIAGHSLPPGASPHNVFTMTALIAFIGYSLALWQMSIWYRRAWSTTIKATIDGLIYALITGGMFLWCWPK